MATVLARNVHVGDVMPAGKVTAVTRGPGTFHTVIQTATTYYVFGDNDSVYVAD